MDNDKTTEVVKKLKLTGTPFKIFKNTCFVKDMFTSPLEIAKFEGASIRTVSGIRGMVKKALAKPPGYFRATFEDKLLMSGNLFIILDIIFLRAWYPVKPKKYYNTVQSLLVDSKQWSGMRTNGQIRREDGLKLHQNKDSFYKPIERKKRVFNKLHVPKTLQQTLPFASKPKLLTKRNKPSLLTRHAVVMEPEEKKVHTLIQRINTIANEKQRKKKIKNQEVHAAFLKKRKGVEEKDAVMTKERRKEHYKAEGKKRAREDAAANGGKFKKRKSA